MDPRKIIDVLELATADIRGFMPDAAGVILIVVTDGSGVKMASNLPPAVARAAISRVDATDDDDGWPYTLVPPRKLRRAV